MTVPNSRSRTRICGSVSPTMRCAAGSPPPGLELDRIERLGGGELTVILWRGVKPGAARAGACRRMNRETEIALNGHAPLFAEARGDIAVSFEFFPPKTDAMAETLWRSIETLAPLKPALRLGDLWRRRLDPRADPCHGRADRQGNRPDAGRASHLRRRDARGNRRDRAELLGGGGPPHRRAARRSARAGPALSRRIRAATPMPPSWLRA